MRRSGVSVESKIDMAVYAVQRALGRRVSDSHPVVGTLKSLVTALPDLPGGSEWGQIADISWHSEPPEHLVAVCKEVVDLLLPLALAIRGLDTRKAKKDARRHLESRGLDPTLITEYLRNRHDDRLRIAVIGECRRTIVERSIPVRDLPAEAEQMAAAALPAALAATLERATADLLALMAGDSIDFAAAVDTARQMTTPTCAADGAQLREAEIELVRRLQRRSDRAGYSLSDDERVRLAVLLLRPDPRPPEYRSEVIGEFMADAQIQIKALTLRYPPGLRLLVEDAADAATLVLLDRLSRLIDDCYVGVASPPKNGWPAWWRSLLPVCVAQCLYERLREDEARKGRIHGKVGGVTPDPGLDPGSPDSDGAIADFAESVALRIEGQAGHLGLMHDVNESEYSHTVALAGGWCMAMLPDYLARRRISSADDVRRQCAADLATMNHKTDDDAAHVADLLGSLAAELAARAFAEEVDGRAETLD